MLENGTGRGILWTVCAVAGMLCINIPGIAGQLSPRPPSAVAATATAASVQTTELERVERIHRHFNRLRRISDSRQWGQKDYWATPSELLRAGGGDCEDIAAAKYFALRELGVPAERLRLVYTRVYAAKLRRIEPHIVLWYRSRPDAEWRVLDSLQDEIRSVSQRRDLLPSLTFNEDRVASWEADGKERVLGKPELLHAWYQLLERQRMLDSVAMVIYLHNLL